MFIEREVTDPFPQLLEQATRRLIQLLTQWKTIVAAANAQTVNKVYCFYKNFDKV